MPHAVLNLKCLVCIFLFRIPEKFNPFNPQLKEVHIFAENLCLKNASIYYKLYFVCLSVFQAICMSVFLYVCLCLDGLNGSARLYPRYLKYHAFQHTIWIFVFRSEDNLFFLVPWLYVHIGQCLVSIVKCSACGDNTQNVAKLNILIVTKLKTKS